MKKLPVKLLVIFVLLSGCTATIPNDRDMQNNSSNVVSEFPEKFNTEPVIVMPDNPSLVEKIAGKQSSAIISANTDASPLLITNSELTDTHRDKALVIINQSASSVFNANLTDGDVNTDASTLGDRKGNVVITENPQNTSQPLMVVTGSDVFGLWASTTAIDQTDTEKASITTAYDAVSQEEVEQLESIDSIGGQLLLQVNAKHRYVTTGNTTMGGYIEDLHPSELLFQQAFVYTTSQFNESEIRTFRTRGIDISQDDWISRGDGGSYTVAIPISEINQFAQNKRVTRVESRENIFTTAQGVEPVKPTSQQ